MGNQCTNLASLSNPCELKHCVQSVNLLIRSSASKSNQWIVTLQPNTHYNGQPVSKVFLKLFLNPSSLTPLFMEKLNNYVQLWYSKTLQLGEREFISSLLDSLQYEMKINGSIIMPVVQQHICPFFPVIYSVGYNCTFDDLLDMFPGQGVQRTLNSQNIARLVTDTLTVHHEKKVADKPMQNIDFIKQSQFCVLMSEVMKGESLYSWCLRNKVFTDKAPLKQDLWMLLFQVAYACYTLELAGVSHNDLHSGNVFVTTHAAPVSYYICTSLTSPVYYRFQTVLQAKVYDFDHASSVYYENAMIESSQFVRTHSYSHQVLRTKDFFKLIIDLAHITSKGQPVFDEVLHLVVRQPVQLMPLLRKMYKAGNSLQQGGLSLKKYFFNNLHSLPEIMSRLAVKAGISMSTSSTPSPIVAGEEFYAVDPSFFENGHVKRAAVYNSLLTDNFYEALQEMNAVQQQRKSQLEGEVKEAQAYLALKTQQARNLEVEVRQQEYDLAQLRFKEKTPL